MSEKINDGGPAFPSEVSGYVMTENEQNQLQFSGVHPGMTLRDWFAGQFVSAYCNTLEDSEELPYWNTGLIAQSAYRMADAMLAARNKTFPPAAK